MTGGDVDEPTFAEALSLHQRGQLDAADALYRAILAADPTRVVALLHLGALRMQQGRNDEAIGLTRAAVALDPDNAEAHSNLGTGLFMAGQPEEAVACFEMALAADPERPESYYGLGLALHTLHRFDEATACFERALIIDPDYPEASCGLGAAFAATKDLERAATCFYRALDIDPDYVDALCGLAEVLQAQQREEEALEFYQSALQLRPHHPQTLIALGRALQATARQGEAIERFREAVAVAPDSADAQFYLGVASEEIGRLGDAELAFEAALALQPENLHYALATAHLRKVREGDRAVATVKMHEDRLDALGDDERVVFHFAAAKMMSDFGRKEEAFEHLMTANALKRLTLAYDEAGTMQALSAMQALFTTDFVARFSAAGDPSALPIFIVGMPRSGSTLVEQILASHRAVFGGGERIDLTAAMKLIGLDLSTPDFFQSCSKLDESGLQRLGAEYVRRLTVAAASAGMVELSRITDKMLANYCFVGLIHLALPNARVIHTRRDPIDVALSCFSRLFASEIPYAYDLAELGRYYRAYKGLMDHWHAVLPPGVVLDVQYEDLVADFEPQVRRILAHCGLDWDVACLAFHETERIVRTASMSQVRQPIYRNAVGRWRPKSEALQPLLDALAST